MKQKQLALVGLGVSLSLLLSGCFVFEGPKPDAPERVGAEVGVSNPQLHPDGTAEENKDFFTSTLLDYSAGDDEFTSGNIARALLDAGFVEEQMQITFDETLTNLPADTVTVSVLFGEECLLGQIERKGREVFVTEAAALGPDKNVCIIGKTAQI